MTIMQQSSKAQDQTLGVWFHAVQQGQVKLPRFQRAGDAWDRGRVTNFLNTIISNLPVGVALVLEVAGEEKFVSRFIETADPSTHGAVTQHLLDGQQRLTSFWRAMHNNYEKETYFVYVPEYDIENIAGGEIEVHCIPRWQNKKTELKMPRWAEDPAQCFVRGRFPISLLRPGDIAIEIDQWLDSATKQLTPEDDAPNALEKFKAYTATREKLKAEITTLRERVTHFNLPYLSLPSETRKDVALQVFINMNTNSKPLSVYDIIVAEVEGVADVSLHDLAKSLDDICPGASRYETLQDLILSTSALLQDKLPNMRGMVDMDKKLLLENWPKLERGLSRMASFLDSQGVFDAVRLPTNAVLAVIAAAYEDIPDEGDFAAKGEQLLKRYLWSAFFTDRYENTAASRAFADFKAIKSVLANPQFGGEDIASVPVLNRAEFPLATADSLMSAGWPKATGISARAILAVTTHLGATDFADNKTASNENIGNREYHHIFPDALLDEAGISSHLALNCALITWKTNRMIGRKDPLDYLRERVVWADEKVVRERLESHLISYEQLSKAHYDGLEGSQLKEKLEQDFDIFLRGRAELVVLAMEALTKGESPSLDELWAAETSQENSAEET